MVVHRVDPGLMRDLKRFGAFDVDGCFNCGNCTAVCQHSDETASFPRRLIRYGQLGMRDRLLAAREAWLCWNCRECSESCPRRAKPSEYLEAVRRYTIVSLDPTGVSRLIYSSGVFAIGLAVLLALLFAGVLLSRAGSPTLGSLDLFGFIPFELIHDLGVAVMVATGLVAAIATARLVGHLSRSMELAGHEPDRSAAARNLWGRVFLAARAVLGEMALQRRFRTCAVEAGQPLVLRPWFVHYSIMWGFLGLAAATAFDFLFKVPGEAVALWYPSRLVGTIAGLSLMYGTVVTIARRMESADPIQARMLPSDWLFLGLLFAVGSTGFALEVLLYAPGATGLGYGLFLVHVALAMELLVLLPFTKFAHAMYRPLAYGIYRFKTASPGGQSIPRSEAVGEHSP